MDDPGAVHAEIARSDVLLAELFLDQRRFVRRGVGPDQAKEGVVHRVQARRLRRDNRRLLRVMEVAVLVVDHLPHAHADALKSAMPKISPAIRGDAVAIL